MIIDVDIDISNVMSDIMLDISPPMSMIMIHVIVLMDLELS